MYRTLNANLIPAERKIWQKIMILLHRLEEGDERTAGGEERRDRAVSL